MTATTLSEPVGHYRHIYAPGTEHVPPMYCSRPFYAAREKNGQHQILAEDRHTRTLEWQTVPKRDCTFSA